MTEALYSGTRILCVGAHRSPSNAYRRSLAFGRLGCTVGRVDTSRYGYTRNQTLRRVIQGPGGKIVRSLLKNALMKAVKREQPEIVWFEKCLVLSGGDLRDLRRMGPPGMLLVHYNPDDPFGAYGAKPWAAFIEAMPEYDVHFVPKPINVEEYEARGAKRVFTYDRAYDPELHKPMVLGAEDKAKYSCDVGFIGTWAPQREAVIAQLIQSDIPVYVWGNGWKNGTHWSVIRPFWKGAGQFDLDYTKAICGMKIALHFLRHENRDEQDSRTFEIPACGTFMLAERSPAHERLFVEGEEAVFFGNDIEELVAHLHCYLANQKACKKIAAGGRCRCVQSGYDHDSRLQELLRMIKKLLIV